MDELAKYKKMVERAKVILETYTKYRFCECGAVMPVETICKCDQCSKGMCGECRAYYEFVTRKSLCKECFGQ